MRKISLVMLAFIVVLSGCQSTGETAAKKEPKQEKTKQVEKKETKPKVKQQTFEIAQQEKNQVVHKAGRYIVQNSDNRLVIANKKYELIPGYTPKDLTIPNVTFSFPEKAPKRYMRQEAAIALQRLFTIAQKEGMMLVAVSGYRPYERQDALYRQEVKAHGAKKADQYVAKPGHSEHQTGLAIDVSAPSVNNALAPSLGQTKEGKWLAANAHRAGFIIRYELGKEEVTGYNYEPWHIRYIGVEHATRVYKEKLTLEQYLAKYKGIELAE